MFGKWKFKNISKNTNIVLKLILKYLFKRVNILHTNTRNTKKLRTANLLKLIPRSVIRKHKCCPSI